MLGVMIDTHCHLDSCTEPGAADPSLAAIVSVGTDPASCRRTLELAEHHPNVWAVLGVHPNSAAKATPAARAEIERLVMHPKCVGIGETGFDAYWDEVPLETQHEVFDWHADLAKRLGKPLILHVRDKQNQATAAKMARKALQEAGHPQGILHCFNGHEGLLETGLGLGWHMSFAGNLTYKSARNLQAAAKRIPLERLLVETDSPYLAPEPKRGRRNVPAHVRHTAAFLAELRGVTLEALEPILDSNARAVYGLPE
jgi:TatD DNase family protein